MPCVCLFCSFPPAFMILGDFCRWFLVDWRMRNERWTKHQNPRLRQNPVEMSRIVPQNLGGKCPVATRRSFSFWPWMILRTARSTSGVCSVTPKHHSFSPSVRPLYWDLLIFSGSNCVDIAWYCIRLDEMTVDSIRFDSIALDQVRLDRWILVGR